LWPSTSLGAGEVSRVDSTKIQVTIAVGKAGAFSFIVGHTHEGVGPIAFDRERHRHHTCSSRLQPRH